MTQQLFPFDRTSSARAGRAKATRWLDGVLEWLTDEADSGKRSRAFLPPSIPSGFLAKTSPVFCRSVAVGFAPQLELCDRVTQFDSMDENADALDALTDAEFKSLTQDAISSVCWPTWRSSGMGPPTAFSTLNGGEFHSGAVVCSLSDVLEETGDVQPRCYLSPKVCRGILCRAEKRGRELPEPLRVALEQAAEVLQGQEKAEDKTVL